MPDAITILHISDMQFGKYHRFAKEKGEIPNDHDTLTKRLIDDLECLAKDYQLRPDLIICTGDLAEWGMPGEFKDAFAFLAQLCEHYDLPRSRCIVIPGNHDINRSNCSAYFEECKGDGVPTVFPWFPKWKHYKAAFDAFYAGTKGITFEDQAPWTLFADEDIQVVVAGLNSTIDEGHNDAVNDPERKDKGHHGLCTEGQLRWFEDQLRKPKFAGWLCIGAIHHNVIRECRDDEQNLHDSDLLAGVLGPHLHLVLHGHTHEAKAAALTMTLPVYSTGSASLKTGGDNPPIPTDIPNQYQFLVIDRNSITRYCRQFAPRNKPPKFIADARQSKTGHDGINKDDVNLSRVRAFTNKSGLVDVSGEKDMEPTSEGPSPSLNVSDFRSIDELRHWYSINVSNLHPCAGAELADLDWELVTQYAVNSKLENLIDESDHLSSARSLGLLADIPVGGVRKPHKAAILCFAKRPTQFYPQARATFVIGDIGAPKFRKEKVYGKLTDQFRQLVELTMAAIGTVSSFKPDGMRDDMTPELPASVIREAISNAVVHRDYDATGTVLINVGAEYVDIFNPGEFPKGATWETLLAKRYTSHPTDPAIALYVNELAAFEGLGRGFQVFREYIAQNGPESISCETFSNPSIIRLRIFRSTSLAALSVSSVASNESTGEPSAGSEERIGPTTPIIRLPEPPAFYAEPDYIGSHTFVGRARELEELSDWAKPADPTNLLLYEAIGGNGKSMLTWEWTTKHAPGVRGDWAGRFWYSFYEKGAIMSDFCQRALAYMTQKPLEDFKNKKTPEMAEELLALLHARPYLLILDGLERVLVAYHRIDAAEVPDEEANAPTDKIGTRNPYDAIRDEDNDLLRALAATAPSKILVSSRLTPRVLLNPSGQPITGARRITLPGLRPPDAEQLLRSCGIEGDSAAIQNYLTANCDNHPLVIGVLGGLINQPGKNRGNFDAWAVDPDAGAALNLGSLDLIQGRNHILRAALDALSPESWQLLSTLALLTESVDYETLAAFNPHMPPEPEKVEEPEPPEQYWRWDNLSSEDKADLRKQYEADLMLWQEYESIVKTWMASAEVRAAPKKLEATVADLERRGLLQWDNRERKYNLHPVVRGVASGGMAAADTERHGQRVVDYFSAQPHRPYADAESLEDVRNGLHIVRTLIRMGCYEQAAEEYRSNLSYALYSNLDAPNEVLSLLHPFFPDGWAVLPAKINLTDAACLAYDASNALAAVDQKIRATQAAESALLAYLKLEDWVSANISIMSYAQQVELPSKERCLRLALALADVSHDIPSIADGEFDLYIYLVDTGRWEEADVLWAALVATGIKKSSSPSGSIELGRIDSLHQRGQPDWEYWSTVEVLIKSSKSARTLRQFHGNLGYWRLEQGEWALAAASLQEAVRMARERSISDVRSETSLALAKYHLGQLADPHHEVERLAQLRNPAHRRLAQIWLALGDHAKAKHHALAAYKDAWAEGEPYVYRYELDRTTELLNEMSVPIPELPPYNPAKHKPRPWEADVRAAIEQLKAEKQAGLENEGENGTSHER